MSEPRDPKTDDANSIMGEERRKSGFALDPRKHADYLRSKGETHLSSVLDSAPIVAIMDRYERLDRAALASQTRFRSLCAWTLSVIALLIYVSLVALALPLSEDLQRSARFWSLAVIYLGMLIGFLGMAWLYYSKPDVAWRQARAGAEAERGRVFDAVMDADRDKPDLLPLKLEYIRRFQLDLQEDYYCCRGAQHEAKVRRSFYRKLIFFVFALLAVAAMAATQFLDKGEDGISAMNENVSAVLLKFEAAYTDLALLLLALALASWWAVSYTLAQIEGTSRNATLFAIARDKLAAFRKAELEPARRAAAEAKEPEIRAFVSKLQSVLTSEHQGWIALENAIPEPQY
jgi:hypothetical protein